MLNFINFHSRFLERLRLRLAGASALPVLAFLGLMSGIIVGAVIILFRLLIESSQASFLPGGDPELYESLSASSRFIIAASGGIVLGIIFFLFSKPTPRVGMIHVMERLAYYEGHIPLKNALLQFFAGALAIISGQSVGREGPSVHLGAASASLMGQRLRLPNNSIRTLVACGSAAAIASSFNTPLAGVIFSMEVVMMEYTIVGFTPVILAAVSATVLSRMVFDTQPTFMVPALELVSFWELLVIVVMGLLIGGMSALFIKFLKWVTEKGLAYPVWLRMGIAGIAVGICGFFVPEIMGIGYDTVNLAILGDLTLYSLCLIAVFKLIATALSVGLSIPGGLIGPTLVMGAMIGGATGQLVGLFPGMHSHTGLYAMLGMGAMMGATLQAPLAALVALLELTGNQNIIFPGMLVIVTANLVAKELFGQGSVFLSQMKGIGIDFRNDPIAQSLRRFAVASVMNQNFAIVKADLGIEQAKNIIKQKPQWLVLIRETKNLLMPAADLARFIEENEESEADVNLLEIPSKRLQLAPVLQQATLQEALKLLIESEAEAEALYVIRPIGTAADRIYGIVTRQDIEQSYRRRDNGF